jgi:protocatechuate 3,4-dioxygenase beta subunit
MGKIVDRLALHYMPRGTRRDFLVQLSAGAAVLVSGARVLAGNEQAQNGLDKFLVPAPPCRDDLTPEVPAGVEYRSGAPLRRSLVERGVSGQRMTLSGYVTGLTCGRIKGARIDFWQADAAGKVDRSGFQLRGAVITDADGRYSIETIVPGREVGRARRIGVRVEPPAKKALTTTLFFPGDETATKEDRTFKAGLVMKRVAGVDNSYTFDFLLDA